MSTEKCDALLSELKLMRWERRFTQQADATAVCEMQWEQLEYAASRCTQCALHKTRTHPVFGVGNRKAALMIIGEAPGFYEDRQGEPFVGRAGQLLNAMLKSIGLAREAVYIANILKCRPPKNRAPERQEVALCTPYLDRQITLIQPRLLLALGRIAAHYLLQCEATLSVLRQQMHCYQYGPKVSMAANEAAAPQILPLIVTYHPAYLLRNPADKVKAQEDLKRVKEYLADVV